MFDFTKGEGPPPLPRVVQDAPESMRMQLVAAIYKAAAEPVDGARSINVDIDLYPDISLLLGVQPARVMNDAYRQRIAKNLGEKPWTLTFDVIVSLWETFRRNGRADAYRNSVNSVLALHGIAWDLDVNGRLQRVLPEAAQSQVAAMFAELARPEFYAARDLANTAQRHFDARPREPRDAVSNMFDAMESIAKVRLGEALRTFGNVCDALQKRSDLSEGMLDTLKGLNKTRNTTFGHGYVGAFNMSDPEIDFTYLVCAAGALLLARLPIR